MQNVLRRYWQREILPTDLPPDAHTYLGRIHQADLAIGAARGLPGNTLRTLEEGSLKHARFEARMAAARDEATRILRLEEQPSATRKRLEHLLDEERSRIRTRLIQRLKRRGE